ncbi:unnamed protein product [Lota lota]
MENASQGIQQGLVCCEMLQQQHITALEGCLCWVFLSPTGPQQLFPTRALKMYLRFSTWLQHVNLRYIFRERPAEEPSLHLLLHPGCREKNKKSGVKDVVINV